jgi:phage host-nuclease inhibitor protein Gam
MALASVPPLPPELAQPEQFPPPEVLDLLWDEAAALADDTDQDPAHVVHDLAESEDGPTRWVITDDGAAEWAMRHVAEASTALAQLEAQRDEWVRRIDAWFTAAAGRERARRSFFTQHLEGYALEQRDRANRKTVQLPSGTIRTRPTAPTVAVLDESKVLAWAREAGVLDQVAPPKHSVKLTPLRELVEPVEVVDWAHVVLADGTSLEWMRHGVSAVYDRDRDTARVIVHGEVCPQVGDAPDDDWCTALVAQVEVLASHLEVRGPDGGHVPGTYVEPGGVTASVKPELPEG